MRILLINPPYRESTYTSPPLGIAYIASVLRKQGHEPRILDCPALGFSCRDIAEAVEKFQPGLVGITAMTPVIKEAIEAARTVKSVTNVPILIGGPHASIMPEDILKNVREIDFIARGEGEMVIGVLVGALKKGRNLSSVKGLSFRRGSKIIHNPNMPLIKDLDSIPFPARDLLPMGRYKQHIGHPTSFTTMITSRGCPYQCTYCTKAVFGNLYRARSPENMVKEMEEVLGKWRVKEFVFYDDTFTIDRKRIIGFCRLLIEKGIRVKWKCEARVNLVDQELLNIMTRAGCYVIAYGVESGNPKLMKTIKKGFTKGQVRKAFRMTKKAGIETLGYFMIGIPGETGETIKETLDFAIELDPDYAQFAIATPYPKTELYAQAKRKCLLEETDWERYSYFGDSATPVMRTEKLSTGELKMYLKQITRKFYFRRRYIMKQLVKSMSVHAMRRNISGLLTILRWTK